MDLGLKGKVALVTGAGSQIGFGKEIALTLVREGCEAVAVTDINLDDAKLTAEALKAVGARSIAVKADVTDKAEVDAMVSMGTPAGNPAVTLEPAEKVIGSPIFIGLFSEISSDLSTNPGSGIFCRNSASITVLSLDSVSRIIRFLSNLFISASGICTRR